ncbi:MAG: YibE/F family protein [Candidatus Delongbacteria bacterium]|nr:YibE/F family protein [Candidatus Delongbacteria bacterium]MBN2835393.1 YibE/F family protein [Candidatus Delongbacteria bacterium]
MKTVKYRDMIFAGLLLLFTIYLVVIPTGFEKETDNDYDRAKAVVLNTDNSDLEKHGIINTGCQNLEIRILDGKFKGFESSCTNFLYGKMELDKMFIEGDYLLASINFSGDKIISCEAIDHYRINYEIWLFSIFVIFLIIYAGFTGLKAVLSFIFSGLFIWKILLPGFLKGYDPVILSLIVVMILTAIIIFLVGGLNNKGYTAFLGSCAGIIITSILSILFGDLFVIHGAIKPFSETLLYSGFPHLDLTEIFLAGIFLASSGAVMDIAMDISASQHEIFEKNPNISRKELIFSGFRVGRAVVGTMTTTLLLAYSGGFTGLLMVFMAQGTPMTSILNLNYVSAEILHTIVGSFGLVTVAPMTAIMGGFIYVRKNRK